MKKLLAIAILSVSLASCNNDAKIKAQCKNSIHTKGKEFMLNNDASVLSGNCPKGGAYTLEKDGVKKLTAGSSEAKVLTCPTHGFSLRADGSVK